MSATSVSPIARALLLASCAPAFMMACTEPNHAAVAATPAPVLEAMLDVSDSSARPPALVTVTLQLRGNARASVASFTARVAYDATALRFESDSVIADNATRVSNPQPGLVRVAGIAPQGFQDGTLYAARFTVLDARGVSTLRLIVDEMHNTARNDVAASLVPRAR